NLILPQTLDQAFGFNTYYDNGGTLKTSGIEASIDTRNVLGQVLWNAGLTVSTQVNEITRLSILADDQQDYFITSIEGAELITKVGNPMFSFYGYETDGVFSSSEGVTGPNGYLNEAGDIIFVDRDDNDIIDDNDKTLIGNPNPQLFGGFFNSIYYKNFNLDLNFTFNLGNDLYNYLRMRGESMDDLYNQRSEVTGRWTGDGTSSEIPRNNVGDSYGNSAFSDRWIEDGSYVRLKNIILGYTFEKSTRVYKNLMIYATATNLFTFTSYSGYDPEFLYNNNPEYLGVDYGKIPHPRSFVIGIKLGL
ncbi:MAG: SusC/RagA family TonB-linked outer membrane protein, partial [Bacteroidales bacterium]|nr:SusC/RagA family TonB-linked outer membrane protein [Bacteroidales bacterium]